VVGLAVAAPPPSPAPAPAPYPVDPGQSAIFERVKDAVFTIEVHSGNTGARSVIGSGYLVSEQGHLLTNYHVVGSYVDEPGRYQIRARDGGGAHVARLVRFDLINDLALLQAEGLGGRRPLRLSDREPAQGERIVALGNPEGLGMSLIEGVFNGHASKGVVDRLLLSMPLNSGMSGGPILDGRGEVVGTNVSVIWLSNSLSFGVPAASARPLLEPAPTLEGAKALRAEVTRQLDALEARTVERAITPIAAGAPAAAVKVGDLASVRFPDLYECWDQTQVRRDKGFTRRSHSCNLQFTPSVEDLGEVGSVQIQVHRDEVQTSAFGFFDSLEKTAESDHEPRSAAPDNGVLGAPACVTDRVAAGALVWHVNTCLNPFVKHPGFLNLDASAVSLSEPSRAAVVVLRLRGFRLEPALALLRRVLESTRPEAGP
jgi:S1-C subfamily serine protease